MGRGWSVGSTVAGRADNPSSNQETVINRQHKKTTKRSHQDIIPRLIEISARGGVFG